MFTNTQSPDLDFLSYVQKINALKNELQENKSLFDENEYNDMAQIVKEKCKKLAKIGIQMLEFAERNQAYPYIVILKFYKFFENV